MARLKKRYFPQSQALAQFLMAACAAAAILAAVMILLNTLPLGRLVQ